MNASHTFDVIIVGGGLAGLAAAILLARKQHNVALFEKEEYPRHKVCGEYVGLESLPFLRSLGLPLADMNLPEINNLVVSDCDGNVITESLNGRGGIGISRYLLDAKLATIAATAGATIHARSPVDRITFEGDTFYVDSGTQRYTAKIVLGAWGKRSSMDIRLRRGFAMERNSARNNYVGIKYHVRYPWPKNTIGLHHFTGGYCGVAPVEDNKTCLCYLTNAATLKRSNNSLRQLEKDVISKNNALREIWEHADFIYLEPLAISQISMRPKEKITNHVLQLGDSAGMIAPLCGNGMSMALRSAKIAAICTDLFLCGQMTRTEMEEYYTNQWQTIFSKRIAYGRAIQNIFNSSLYARLLLKVAFRTPLLRRHLLTNTAGEPF